MVTAEDDAMVRYLRYLLALIVFTTLVALTYEHPSSTVSAREPDWARPIVMRPRHREFVDSTPVRLRPNRPFHVYGNTVRRMYYRGQALPRPRDAVNGTAAILGRRSSLDDFAG
jgi:hypothetical protein